MSLGWVTVPVIVVLLIGEVDCRHINVCPQHRGLSEGLVRGENKIRDRALYRLDVRHATQGFIPGQEYTFRVHTTYRKLKFNDATIIVEELDEKCGHGRLIVDSDQLYSPQGCPDIVTTQEKDPMGRAHFKWQAPKCGCVHIRIRVHSDGQYFLADDKDISGPLVRTICSTEIDAPQTTVQPSIEQLPRKEKLELLCKAWTFQKAEQLLKHRNFIDQRGVEIKNQFDIDRLATALELRRFSTLECCSEKGNRMLECFGDLRRHRIDNYCGNGEPDIPLSKRRLEWIQQKQSDCCWQIGEARYTCFNYSMADGMLMDERSATTGDVPVNMDDFDPVNDLHDFGPDQLTEIRKDHNDVPTVPTKDGMANVKSDDADDDEDDVDEKDDATDDDNNKAVVTAKDDNSDKDHSVKRNNDTSLNDEKEELTETNYRKETNSRKDNNVQVNRKSGRNKKSGKLPKRPNSKDLDPKDIVKTFEDANDKDSVESMDDVDKGKNDDLDVKADPDEDVVENTFQETTTPTILLTEVSCCMHGIPAGAKVAPLGLRGCFQAADVIRKRVDGWTETCDRSFVVCCMRAVDASCRQGPHKTNSLEKTTHTAKNLNSIVLKRRHNPNQSHCYRKLCRIILKYNQSRKTRGHKINQILSEPFNLSESFLKIHPYSRSLSVINSARSSL